MARSMHWCCPICNTAWARDTFSACGSCGVPRSEVQLQGTAAELAAFEARRTESNYGANMTSLQASQQPVLAAAGATAGETNYDATARQLLDMRQITGSARKFSKHLSAFESFLAMETMGAMR